MDFYLFVYEAGVGPGPLGYNPSSKGLITSSSVLFWNPRTWVVDAKSENPIAFPIFRGTRLRAYDIRQYPMKTIKQYSANRTPATIACCWMEWSHLSTTALRTPGSEDPLVWVTERCWTLFAVELSTRGNRTLAFSFTNVNPSWIPWTFINRTQFSTSKMGPARGVLPNADSMVATVVLTTTD